MKLPYDKKYATIAIYSFLVIVVSAICILGITHYQSVAVAFSALMKILTPFIFGAVVAYILNPILKTIERFLTWATGGRLGPRGRRTVGILGTYIFAFAILSALIGIIIPQVVESITNLVPQVIAWLNTLPTVVNDLAVKFNLDLEMLTQAETLTMITRNLQENISSLVSDITSLIPKVFQLTTSLVGKVLNILIGVIVSIYLLSSKELFYAHIKKICYALLPRKAVDKLIEITHTSNDIFIGFIVGKIVDSAIIGVICFIVMSLFSWPYALLISVIIGITNIIPYFGPFIGAIPSILLLLIIDPGTAIKFTLFIIILQQVDGNIIGPKILGDTTGLSAFWVVFSITLFSALLGPIGMIIGVPTFAVIYSLIREFSEWLLHHKRMATATDAYASAEHPIIRKEKSPPHPRPLTEDELGPQASAWTDPTQRDDTHHTD